MKVYILSSAKLDDYETDTYNYGVFSSVEKAKTHLVDKLKKSMDIPVDEITGIGTLLIGYAYIKGRVHCDSYTIDLSGGYCQAKITINSSEFGTRIFEVFIEEFELDGE